VGPRIARTGSSGARITSAIGHLSACEFGLRSILVAGQRPATHPVSPSGAPFLRGDPFPPSTSVTGCIHHAHNINTDLQ
jgi:hypothetical protein